jgi:hypothetical protein
MSDDKLKVIAHELLLSLKDNISVNWAHRESACVKMRVLVKRVLRKYGYPPDLRDTAVQTVLQQAEVLSAGWTIQGFCSWPTTHSHNLMPMFCFAWRKYLRRQIPSTFPTLAGESKFRWYRVTNENIFFWISIANASP